jgi:SAM-dependent methyltransferase
VKKLSDRDVVAREYATIDRLAMRRLDRTAWLAGDEPWLLALAAIAEVRPARVLDAGCGSGDFAALLTAPDVRCVDLSQAAVEAARAKRLRADVADIQNLPFPDGSFDVAVANWVLYHVQDRARAIAELARVLTPAGRFVGCYNAPGHLQELWSSVGVAVDADDFNADNGAGELQQSFRQVQVREAHGEVLWETRERVQAYLDAYREMYGSLTVPAGPYPLRATRRNVVLVADR